MELILKAPAKLNLALYILGRRPDGYHQLATLMQPLGLHDLLRLRTGEPGLRFSCDRPELDGADNLVARAARRYYRELGHEPALAIHLTKNIPVAAGLGGGSSDAAACLLGLNALHQGALSPETLCRLASGLGADVPFFLGGITAFCGGVGDEIHPWPAFPLLSYVLINPRIEVSTAWVYREFDLTWTKAARDNKIRALPDGSQGLDGILHNDLEQVTLRAYPQLDEAKKELVRLGARGALMSGSGPTVFGVFANPNQARQAADIMRTRHGGWWIASYQGIGA